MMKKHNVFAILVLLFSLVVVTSSCKDDKYHHLFRKEKKKDKEKDHSNTEDCITLVSTENVDQDFHFWALEGDFINKQLYAENYADYASKIQPDKKYKLGYRLVPCKTMMPQYKYTQIEITCLTEVESDVKCDCKLQPILNDDYFSQHGSYAQTGAYIKDDKLYVKGYFISTDKMYAPDYQLYLKENFVSNIYPMHMLAKLDVKSLQKDTGQYTDLRSFEQDYCYDLKPIKDKYNMTMPPGKMTLHIELTLTDGNTEVIKYEIQ